MNKRVRIYGLIIASMALIYLFGASAPQMDDSLSSSAANTKMEPAREVFPAQSSNGAADGFLDENADRKDKAAVDERWSTFGVLLPDPWLVYSGNIVLAQEGDAGAQYEISRVLFECKAVTSQRLIDKYAAEGIFTEETAQDAQEQLDWCRELNDNIGSDLMRQSLDWLDAAAEQGHVLALGRQVAFAPYDYSPDEAKEVMMGVVRSGEPEMYAMMMSYYANYRDDEFVSYEAWSTLMRQNITGCEMEEYRRRNDLASLRPGEQAQVDAAVELIATALDANNWTPIADLL